VNASQNTSREWSDATKARVREAFSDYLLPGQFSTVVRRALKDTPEYREALAEGHAKAWLEQESDHICQALAAALRDQLTRLDPLHG
jgi:hypothetical protein